MPPFCTFAVGPTLALFFEGGFCSWFFILHTLRYIWLAMHNVELKILSQKDPLGVGTDQREAILHVACTNHYEYVDRL